MDAAAAIAIIETDLRELVRLILGPAVAPSSVEYLDLPLRAKLQERLADERRRRAPAAVPADLLAYTHLHELQSLIERNWQRFSAALGTRKEFAVLIGKANDYRNAPAHSRELLPHERSLLEGVAGEVRSRVVAFRSTRAPDSSYYPVIESITDSFGNAPTTLNPDANTLVHTNLTLRPHQVVAFECRGWDAHGRDLAWQIRGHSGVLSSAVGPNVVLEYAVMEEDVAVKLLVDVFLTSAGRYHRHRTYDQRVAFRYRVDPPA